MNLASLDLNIENLKREIEESQALEKIKNNNLRNLEKEALIKCEILVAASISVTTNTIPN